MKRKISLAAAVLFAAFFASAQVKKEKAPPPPPPPPPVLNTVPPPPPPLPPPPPKQSVASLPGDYKAFLRRNPTVKGIRWSGNNTVHIQLKSGSDEVYKLNDKEEAQNLESKYGKLPAAPPPPPAPPRAPKPIEEL